jgi:ATP P2X receptor
MPRGATDNEAQETWAEWARSLLYYHTVKVVQIRSWKLGALHYGVMLIVAAYVALYAVWWQKGYQEFSPLIAATTVKVKGVSVVESSTHPSWNGEVWDAEDAVFPPKEPSAVFITTNFLPTPQQKRGVCTDPEAACVNGNCVKGEPTLFGWTTGACNATAGRCEVSAWCPAEEKSSGSRAPRNYLKVFHLLLFLLLSSLQFVCFLS